MFAALQQIQDIKGEVNLGATKKSLPMDPSIYGPTILQSKLGLGGASNIASPYIKTRRYFYMDIFFRKIKFFTGFRRQVRFLDVSQVSL
ncbi:unnamed protein product, partial [Vitis vinifera]|uniref:Uncharacterized protein n=1 Tax=Vitis vinifera TaxID=29760 RepID=D7SRT1_VITVI